MNAQPNWIPETVTVTLTRDEIESYAGESDNAYGELVSDITKQGAQKAVSGIVRRALNEHGRDALKRERRTVSVEHAGVGLIEAIFRMTAALEYALTINLDYEENEQTARMVLEGGNKAAQVAAEIMNALDLGARGEDSPSFEECFNQWDSHSDRTGNYLTIDPADVPKAIYWAAKLHFKLSDEQLDQFKAKVREHAEVKRLAFQMIREDVAP